MKTITSKRKDPSGPGRRVASSGKEAFRKKARGGGPTNEAVDEGSMPDAASLW